MLYKKAFRLFFIVLGLHKAYSSDFNFSIPEGTLLVIDILDESEDFPRNFRMCSDSFPVTRVLNYYKKNETLPSRQGLDQLRCSGSAQFSATTLKNIQRIVKAPLIVMDLRLEPHGFLEGHSVSWFAPGNNFYGAKYTPYWHQHEENLIAPLRKAKQTKVYTIIDKYNKRIIEASSFFLSHQRSMNEKELSHLHNVSYVRVPVLDSQLPEDEALDIFLETIKHIPQNAWVHFHCRAGKGRTTLFMILYDIIHNVGRVPLEEIMSRQYLLSPTNFKIYPPERRERTLKLLKNFYAYCADPNGFKKTKWSLWIKNKNALPKEALKL
jgi:hypothetical protein